MTNPKIQPGTADATEVGLALHKAIDACRLYGRGHAARAPFLTSLHRRLAQFLAQFGELVLEVSSTTLSFAGQPLFAAGRWEESLTRVLFLDQVRRLVFLPGIAASEATAFVEIWAASMDPSEEEAHTFSTRVWEADLRGVRLESESLFAHGAQERAEAERVVQALLVERVARVAPPARLGPDELELLEAETGLATHSEPVAEWLPALDRSEQSRQQLAREISGRPERAAPLAIGSMARLAGQAEAREWAQLKDAMRRVLTGLVREGRFDEVEQALRQVIEAARPAKGPVGTQGWVGEVLQLLETPAIRDPLVEALQGPDRCAAASAVVRYSRPEASAAFLDVLPRLPPEQRRTLTNALIECFPRGSEIEARVGRVDVNTTLELLAIARCLPSAEALGVWRRALAQQDGRVRLQALSALRTEDAAAVSSQLLPLLEDASSEVRRRALDLLVRGKVPEALKALGQRLQSDELPAPERKTIITALGRLGGVDACIALRNEFRNQRDPDVKAACALALAQAGDEFSRPLLKSTAGKLLAPAPLRQACEEALRRLDQKRAAEEA